MGEFPTDTPAVEEKVLSLAPTAIANWDDCRMIYKYREIDRLKPLKKAINLLFGIALHNTVEQSVRCLFKGIPFDAAGAFRLAFQAEIAGQLIGDYPNGFDEQSMSDMGAALCADFHDKWPRFGLHPIVDAAGNPIMEKKLEVIIAPGLKLKGKMDITVLNKLGETMVLDFKTARSEADDDFVLVADQLTAYQILVDANREELGLEPVQHLGFIEAIKRKVPGQGGKGKGPTVNPPKLAPRRTDEEIQKFIQKLVWMAEDIRAQKFYRTPRMAYNSPCDMCDYRDLCLRGDMSGIAQSALFGVAPTVDVSQLAIEVAPNAAADFTPGWFGV